MSNAYLRRYLWMLGLWGVRVFFYEARMPDSAQLRALMSGESHVVLTGANGWYDLDIREVDGGLLIQLWAKVFAVSPDQCTEETADGLLWPGIDGLMTSDRANALLPVELIYLDDRFLKRYEQNGLFDAVPINIHGRWNCSPSYRGQWSFTDCIRVGRNLIRVPIRELYKPKPDREILHAYAHALTPDEVAHLDKDAEHIAAKTERLLKELLLLGKQLELLSIKVSVRKSADEIVGLSKGKLDYSGWMAFPELLRIAQVAPLAMTEQAFLSRCKNIHELWQRIPNGFLRQLVEKAGHGSKTLSGLGSLKLLQALTNVLERLNAEGETVNSFGAGADLADVTTANKSLSALFVNNDLRIADAHNAGEILAILERSGFDVASVNQGYGLALDHTFDGVINAFAYLNNQLSQLLDR